MKFALRTFAALIAVAFAASAQSGSTTPTPPQQWSKEVVQLFSTLPVQQEGRVKPLSTHAGFLMLKLHGSRSITVPGTPKDRKLDPMAWMLDTMFYPDAAAHYKIFLIQTTEVVEAIGLKHDDKKKRDRYSYAELEPGINKLFQLAQEYHRKSDGETKNLTPLEGQITALASNVFDYQKLAHFLDFARYDFHIEPGSVLSEIIPMPRLTAVYAKETQLGVTALALERGIEDIQKNLTPEQVEQLRKALPASVFTMDADTRAKAAKEINALVRDARALSDRAMGLALFPPHGTTEDHPEWFTVSDAVGHMSHGDHADPELAGQLVDLEELVRQRDNPPAFLTQLQKFHDEMVTAATARGEYGKIPLEVSFYKYNFFYYALILYVLSFIVVAFSWLAPAKRWIAYLGTALLFPPTILTITGITYRCIIRERPPVSTLYEVILFVTAVACVVAIFIELVNRQRVAMSVGALLGSLGLFIAFRFEAQQGTDTMPQLVAVLDTNFWLATHVTTVTMGYAAGLLAAAIAHVYILGKLFNFKKNDEAFYKNIYRMTYGVICFGLLFSVVGTVLGGIWANDSWGRFWGWDPKENGALMIVLWELAILHARLAGYVRDLGVAMAATFNAIIVAFSLWGVNLLGVGLHSYGFTSGIMPWLITFYIIELIVVFLGAAVWYRQKFARPSADAAHDDVAGSKERRKKPLPAKAHKQS
ncbi:MAG: cytochrome c biogenesis protein CcsA [Candidatus Hydrogenedentes bacterium]|nr:cytochrome c biogenesis protein CcsA [Candidatus Hydrogenedentota bacterium]